MTRKLKSEEHLAVEQVFTYEAPSIDQFERMDRIRNAAKALAHVIVESCPKSTDRSTAVRKLREAVMSANASIVLNGLGVS